MVPRQMKSRLSYLVATARYWRSWQNARSRPIFIAAQEVSAVRDPSPRPGRPRQRHAGTCWQGYWYAGRAGGGWNRPKNAYVREDQILPQPPALQLLLVGA
jgi:hypothetical protein